MSTKNSGKKKIIVICAAVVALVVVAAIFLRPKKDKQVQLTTAKTEKHSINTSITATGTIEPINKVDVGTQVSGIVTKLYVDYNSLVKKGQILAELDKVNLQNEVTNAQNNVESAKTQYEYEKKNYDRVKSLHDQKLISDSEYEDAYYKYRTAKISYDKSKTDLSRAQTNLGYATIYSPIDGTVISKSVEEGQTVAASFSTPTIFTIANDLTKMQVVADVDEADIGGVQEGQRVTFTVDAYPGEKFDGTVKQVRLEAKTTSNVVTYEVIIDAPNNDLKLKPGLTANVSIYTQERNDVVAVPAKALSFNADIDLIGSKYTVDNSKITSNDKHVYTLSGNKLTALPVKTGITGGGYTEIVDGLTLGQIIVTGTSDDLGEGKSLEQAQQSSSPLSMPGPGQRNNKNKK
ncbi:MAG: efflux RND transporter periplasmic adaptor subunit [Bacteroidales bacterium]|nr:efflux RND transporter periplasmic adaptor subunit [Bacteroidales bacterium]